MEKLVVKTAVRTVLIILGLVLIVFAIFNFAFPQHMATIMEETGHYNLALKYADMRYSYTKNCEDLARCFEDSIVLGDDQYIIEFGEKLIEHRDYDNLCRAKRDGYGDNYSYDHRVKSKLSVAYYSSGVQLQANGKTQEGQNLKSKAIKLAFDDNGTQSFEYGNALMSLSARIRTEGDKESASAVCEILENQVSPTDQTEQGYLTEVINILKAVALS